MTQYRCALCGETFPNRRELEYHKVERHFDGRHLQPYPWEPAGDPAPWEADPESGKPEEPGLRIEYGLNRKEILKRHDENPEGVVAVYNFPTNDLPGGAADLAAFMGDANERQEKVYKCRLAVSLMLYNATTDRYRYFSGFNPIVEGLVSKPGDFRRLSRRVRREDIEETIRRERPNTHWRCRMITNVTVRVFRYAFPLGAGREGETLPAWLLKRRRTLASMLCYRPGKPYRDRLCFFRCLAYHKQPRRAGLTTAAYGLYHEWRRFCRKTALASPPKNPALYRGVIPNEMTALEDCFHINIHVYSAVEDLPAGVVPVRMSTGRYDGKPDLYLNMYGLHLSYVKNFASYARKFSCPRCERHFSSKFRWREHLSKNCSKVTRDIHPGGLFKRNKSLFDQLADFDIDVKADDQHYPYHVIFDFEAMLRQIPDADVGEGKLKWLQRHEIISVGLVSNAPGHDEPVCVVNPDSSKLVGEMLDYIDGVQETTSCLMRERLDYAFRAGEEQIERYEKIEAAVEREEKGEDREKQSRTVRWMSDRCKELVRELEVFCDTLQVIGFHSGRYDLNLIKGQLCTELLRRGEKLTVLKKGQNYLSLHTDRCRFVDIAAYISPPKSLRSFLHAFNIEEEKFFFPYGLLTSPESLKREGVPPYDSFYSELKGFNVLEEEELEWKQRGAIASSPYTSGKDNYSMVKKVWRDNDFRTLEDLLRFYNLRDVVPLSKAVESMRLMYKNIGVGIFARDVISIPGVSRKMLYKTAEDQNTQFSLFSKADRDLYLKVKAGVTGGPSLIFRRVTKAGVTYVREDPERPCRNVTCEDANALYLYCIGQKQPCGMYVRRKRENDYQPRLQYRFMKQFRWMDAEAAFRGVRIRHAMNDAQEKRIGNYLCDGFDLENKTIYEFNGCVHHDHWASGHCTLRGKTKKNSRGERYQQTMGRQRVLERLGYTVVVCWECEFDERLFDMKLSRELIDDISVRYLPPFYRRTKNEKKVTKEDILQSVCGDEFFGILEVDIHVPNHLYEKFSYFPPLFVSTEVTIDDVGELMSTHARREGELKKPRRLLVSGMRAEKMMVGSELLKWYIDHGLIVTKVHEAIEYTGKKVFKSFVETIAKNRRIHGKSALSNCFKLLGNSAYGSILLNKHAFQRVCYTQNPDELCRMINNPFFQNATELDGGVYEVGL